jgi:hypothetical protein
MQILFINILMDGALPSALAAASPMPLSSWSHNFYCLQVLQANRLALTPSIML